MNARVLAAAVALALAAAPSVASAADPPPNDNYLSSATLVDPGTGVAPHNVPFTQTVDTTAATVQADLFAPPRMDGGPEPTTCAGTSFGNTIWYDLETDVPGFVDVSASNFDTVIAVYEYNVSTGRLERADGCINAGGSEHGSFLAERDTAYTIQLGGVDAGAGPAAGRMDVSITFFADEDGDTILDGVDRCPTLKGVRAASGCPLQVRPSVEWRNRELGSGIALTSFAVRVRNAKPARVELRCRSGCRIRQARASRGRRPVRFPRFYGRLLPNGAVVELRVTASDFFGWYTRWTVIDGRLSRRVDRCTRPGSRKLRRSCR